jgi:tRNA (mo5U34)-methyltransferase
MEDLRETLRSMGPWLQNVEVAPGIWTNPSLPANHPQERWAAVRPFLGNLSGKTVLDIGCNAGFFAMRAKELGASRVVGIDIDPAALRQARFLIERSGLEIELQQRSVYDIAELGSFDVVFCLGVLYHLRHPLLALDTIVTICRERLFAQMVIRGSSEEFVPAANYDLPVADIYDHPAFPRMFFIERSVNDDETNWWFATRSCLTAMLRSAGFTDITDTAVGDTVVCRPGKPRAVAERQPR